MELRLQYPPTPEHAAKHAQIAVTAAQEVDGISLDFSPRSLEHVDRIVGRFHTDRRQSPPVLMLVFCFGCYFGEVLVRHHGAVWKMPADTSLPDELRAEASMMVVELPNGVIWNPIGKAFNLLENGEVDSVAYSYYVATKQNN